ncbi:hypothetical protein KIN20_017763 [Parelaphostrongylus tenuis]|uniref:Uncharacterized protein n=1 Tax=Parelaphostrongylus tenuis TaxID=148309 RepID=A0AAD5MNP5_PARTN|nr:hypothetical protein KIN20_017763 [Parelaphostrongylus tenuis]
MSVDSADETIAYSGYDNDMIKRKDATVKAWATAKLAEEVQLVEVRRPFPHGSFRLTYMRCSLKSQ